MQGLDRPGGCYDVPSPRPGTPVLLLALLACASPDRVPLPEEDPVALVDYVDPMIGTGGLGFSVGCAYPGAAVPWGLVKVSPDTADANGAAPEYHHGGGYHYDDTHIQSFSHMHMHAIGVTDYGAVGVMPVDRGDPDAPLAAGQTLELGYQAPFSHEREQARPGWYQVQLDGPDVLVTLTATRHTALHRYDFGQVAAPTLVFDLGHVLKEGISRGGWVELDPDTGVVQGQMVVDGGLSSPFSVWFVGELDTAPTAWGTWTGQEGASWSDASGITMDPGGTSAQVEIQGEEVAEPVHARFGGWFGFEPGVGAVHLRVALSTVDLAGAWTNLAEQGGTWDTEVVADDARAEWAALLGALRVWGGSEEDRTKLATALYHAAQMPTIFSDTDGRYTGFDGQIHQADHLYHTDYSLWDTYRTTHPLYTTLWPDWHRGMLQSFARMVEQGGNVPRWAAATGDSETMLGTPANIVWAEAWRKGIRGWGEDVVAPAVIDIALGEVVPAYGGRPDVPTLDLYGYYPADLVGRSVAWTQEAAISDHALAEVAMELGETAAASTLRNRSDAWKRLYNPETGWVQGRYSDGSWEELPDPGIWNEMYAEGNARQYLWLAPQDPEALFEVLGGEEAALARLTETMEETADEEEDRLEAVPNSWYWHGNEPSLHIPWMFGLAGRPDLGRVWVRWVMDTYYGVQADGITGNDDAGASSAWYAFAAMGIYPLAGTERYVLGLPAFERVEWDVGDGVFTVLSEVDPLDGAAPLAVSLGGQPWPAPFLSHDHLVAGGELRFSPAP